VDPIWNDGQRFAGRVAAAAESGHIEEAKAMNPLKRFGDPREIAEAALFLASDGAGYINGRCCTSKAGGCRPISGPRYAPTLNATSST
jgi:NAD(P)-dependent dehydrogenase (short-subunit alcohol dehydrogenase family)